MRRPLLLAAGNRTTAASEPVEYLTIDSGVKFTVDANSIWTTHGPMTPIETLAPWTAFIASSGCTVANTSVSGQQWFEMAADLTDVSAAMDPAKINVLMPGETRNTIFNGKTAEQCLDEFGTYVTNVMGLAVPPDYILPMSCFHSDGVPTAADENIAMLEVDTYIRDNLDEFLASNICWYRDLSPFFQDGTTRSGFMSSTTTCLEDFPGPYVHPRGAARDLIATRMVEAVQQIPVLRSALALAA